MKKGPGEGGGGGTNQYNFTTHDVKKFFEKEKLGQFIKYINNLEDGLERTPEEIRQRMRDILNPTFSEQRRKELVETKQYIRKNILRYLKGKSNAEKLKDSCPELLPDYIKNHIDIFIQKKVIYQKTVESHVEKNFIAMYNAFKNTWNEYRDTELTDKEIIKKIFKIFYNAKIKYEDEKFKAKGDYDDEMERREKKNDSNDMYEKYEPLNPPEETGRDNTYEIFFKVIDPEGKFKEQNKKIFDIICGEFDTLKIEEIKRQMEQKNTLEKEKGSIKEEQNKEHAKLLKEYTKPEIKQQSTQIENASIKFNDIQPQTNKQTNKKNEVNNNQKNDDRAKHANGGVYPHREGETPYD